jgi:hypothetical protein
MVQPNWRIKEIKDAKLFGGKRTPRSGGLWFAKGDSKSDKFLIENKTTDKESFSVSVKLWEKINREALLSRRIPMISMEMGKGKLELVVLSMEDFCSIK